ncbi:phytanoyl-CoA dioxygenase family protein [Dongia sedimenti]|uniref:Phytanoyl-CoA dioxygenase family protein n=1 Tax=Dongia sedimenti TaxID=3064282 RepID=A0ABU0YTM0_9PROT|nr:phytanoyl-CoA dioxygenase family protein [Rhodospirillaceae bacterium R-7]
MPRLLSEDQVRQYKSKGYVFPIPALTADEAHATRARMEDLEAREPDLWMRSKIKPYLLQKWMNDLMRHPRILDAVEDVIGPNILAWAVGHFDKKPHDPGFLAWHQDGTYWGLSQPDGVAAWVALTPSRRENGCLRVVPGTHLKGQIPHRDTYAATNLASRGQEIAVDVDEADAVDLELRPGEISLHHIMLVHGSEPNHSDTRRCGIVLRYVAAHVRPMDGFKDSATLVRGIDPYGHFASEPVPARDFDPPAVAFYNEITAEFRRRKETIAQRYQTERQA